MTSETMVQVRHENRASRARILSGDLTSERDCHLCKVLQFIMEDEEINSKDVLDIITVNTTLLLC